MSNALYPKIKELALSSGMNLSNATVHIQAINLSNYSYSSAHQFFSSVPSNARIGSPVVLSNKNITNGVFTVDAATFSGLVSAPAIGAFIIYISTGTDSTSPLVLYIDTATGLPVNSGATSGTVTWSSNVFSL